MFFFLFCQFYFKNTTFHVILGYSSIQYNALFHLNLISSLSSPCKSTINRNLKAFVYYNFSGNLNDLYDQMEENYFKISIYLVLYCL